MVSAKKRIWGWYFFDWASQPYSTLLLTFIFGPYFAEIASGYYLGTGLDADAADAAAQSFWGWGIAASSAIIAILAPILGAIADSTGRRLIWVWIFSACYIIGAWGLWWVAPGGEIGMLWWGVAFFGLGFIGMEFATIFTNALMPSLSDHEDLGAISGSGFAFGYLGGVVALVIMLGFFITAPDTRSEIDTAVVSALEEGEPLVPDDDSLAGPELGIVGATASEIDQGPRTYLGLPPLLGEDAETRTGTRIVGPFTAIWFILFMIPFFLWVREPKTEARPLQMGRAISDLKELILSLRFRRSLTAYLGSSLLYRDALNALYAFGGVYASRVLGWSIGQVGIFGIIGAVAAVFAAWLGGRADRAFGPRPVIAVSVLILTLVCLVLVGMTREQIWGIALDPASSTPDQLFMICGGLIGAAGGSVQAASRTLMLRHTTPERAAEAFGLFALSGKVTSFIAPALIALVTMISGSQRIGFSPLIALFLLSLILLAFVHPKGEQSR
ncbi:MFS transporter [Pseudogemmobacter faecipullorum]|uniref:MFS transporter n=1 Tax=Pseudogemmobacter faecipullorum TaxID=2755041 RepID=A0ABS8CNT9_9RHOB|nr:MFS transporter [Pseudogemmobacter faecipullorum]MCB5411042.1 MFS transporter [Pseudogemmobacter faecipullorum]